MDAKFISYFLYPYGKQMPGRSNSYGAGVEYRYAYNGMELDNEVSGTGNSYTTEFRQYDPRLGRWKSLNPLMAKFPWMSPYVAFDNNPVFYTDPLGLASEVMGGGDPPSRKTSDGEDREWKNGDVWIDENSDGTFIAFTYHEHGDGEDVWHAKIVNVLPEVKVSNKEYKVYKGDGEKFYSGKYNIQVNEL